MMMTLRAYTRRGKYRIEQWLLQPQVQAGLRAAAYVGAGFTLAAASLNHRALPLAMALVGACTGWSAVLSALGSCIGYAVFWAAAGQQGIYWTLAALAVALLFGRQRIFGETPLLLPAVAGLIVAAVGVVFQSWFADRTPVGFYLLRVVLAAAGAGLFQKVLCSRSPLIRWLCCGVGMLALAQVVPWTWLSLGFPAAAAVSVVGAFPAVALSGLALDLSQISTVPMTAVLCGSYLIRFLPKYPRWTGAMMPVFAYILVGTFLGRPEWVALPGLALGGIVGMFLPQPTKLSKRRGETGIAQVRLEMAASVLAQTEQLLLETPPMPVDEDALVTKAAEQACAGCPCRKNCKDSERLKQLPAAVLHKQLLTPEELPIVCRKSGRLLAQLHRSQEQLRSIHADRLRQQEYRTAVVQQYRFLAEYLQALSDGLSRKVESPEAVFEPQVHIYANRPARENGDRCVMFSGTCCRYYVLLCDGMGTGLGAVQEGKTATELLRRLLSVGYPAKYALQSLNSLCALRSRAGMVTVELLEIGLDSGRATLYKWGAAPSYMVSGYGAEKIGTAGPPPGLSLLESRETAHQLSLRRGELLLLVSDGIAQEQALRCCMQNILTPPGELARSILTYGQLNTEDDATVVTVCLSRRRYEQ